jgi:DNA replication protein DnaC
MLTHPTLETLKSLKFYGMAKALEEQIGSPDAGSLGFDERLGLMVDREVIERENRRLQSRLKRAKLKQNASMEDIDYRHHRGLDKSLLLSLASCQWLRNHHNLLITGPTGAGKSYLACALAHKACLEGHSALYQRLPALLRELLRAKGDGSYAKLMASYAKIHLLILDDWGLDAINREQSLDILELLDDRYDLRSTLVTSQVPVDQWHEIFSDQTLADAILDRLIHNAYRIELKGDSMRKKRVTLTQHDHPE